MRKNIRIIGIVLLYAMIMVGCKKVEIMNQKTQYGEATVNGIVLYDYTTVEEQLANSLAPQFMPLADFIINRNDISYLQTTLRKEDEDNPNSFWFILIGIPADDEFPVLNKEYNIVFNENVNYGSLHRSFEYTRELERLSNTGIEDLSIGIAGLRTPDSENELIPLTGKIIFYKHDAKTGIYYTNYTLKSLDDSDNDSYLIEGEFHKQIQIYK